MSEEVFLESLSEQADREIARLAAEAEKRIRLLFEEAEREALQGSEARIRDAEEEARLLRCRILNEARSEGTKTVLAAVHRLAEEVLEEVAVAAEGRMEGRNGRAVLEALLDECLIEENPVLKEQLKGRKLRLTDDQRRRLAAKGKRIGRHLLMQGETIVTPDTLLRWHRRLTLSIR